MPFEFGIKDIIDIFLVALILYYLYRLMKESRSLNIFIGVMVFVIVWLFVSQVLEMRLLGSILDKLVSVGVIAMIVLFQEEIRKFLYTLGAHQRIRRFARLFTSNKSDKDMEVTRATIMPIVMACMSMSKGKIGALIVIERGAPLEDIIDTGTTLKYLYEYLKDRNPKTLKICALLDKPERRKVNIKGDYIGFTVPDKFLVGYGLDYAEMYRNLPYVGILKEEVYINK